MDYNSLSKSDPSQHEELLGQDLKHSGPGIASFVISLVALVGYIITFVITGVMEASILNEFGELTNDSSQALMFLGVAVLILVVLNIIGVVLGIIGISLRDRRKVFGIIGTIINGVIILVFMLFIATILVNVGAM